MTALHGVEPNYRDRRIHDRFVAAMIDRMKTLVIGDALEPGTEIGPVVDDK